MSSNPCKYTDYLGGNHLNCRLGLRAAMAAQACLACCGLGWTSALSVTTAPRRHYAHMRRCIS